MRISCLFFLSIKITSILPGTPAELSYNDNKSLRLKIGNQSIQENLLQQKLVVLQI